MTANFDITSTLKNAMAALNKFDADYGSVDNTSKTSFTNSIFTLAQNGMAAAEGDDQQKASAITGIVQNLMSMLSNISFSETTDAEKKNRENNKKINDIENTNDATVRNTEAKIQEITGTIATDSNKILEAMKEIENLGGDKGLIVETQEELEEQLKIIEENKAILNGEKEGDKEAALSAIESASAEISSLVGTVQEYQSIIDAQNTVVTDSVENIAQQINESTQTIQEGLGKVQENIAKMQQQGAVNTQVATKGGIDKATGEAAQKAGETMSKVPATAAAGAKLILNGNIRSNTGETEITGATQNLTQVVSSIGQMGSDLGNIANLTNAIGKVGESAIELVGQYESILSPVITAIGSFANIESGNEALTNAINEYKEQISEEEPTENEKDSESENNENVNTDIKNKKFNFDKKVFDVDSNK